MDINMSSNTDSCDLPQEDERRQHFRYKVKLPIDLINSSAGTTRVMTEEVSMSGFHIGCDRWIAQQLVPPGHHLAPSNPVHLTARMNLMDTSEEKSVLTVFCKAVSSIRVSEDEFKIALRFLNFGGASQAKLADFLENIKYKA